MRVECAQTGSIGGLGAKADVAVGPDKRRARQGRVGLSDVEKSLPPLAEGLEQLSVEHPVDEQMVTRSRETPPLGVALADGLILWRRGHTGSEVLAHERGVGVA